MQLNLRYNSHTPLTAVSANSIFENLLFLFLTQC
nr:MAG TPA: hypothetical protein [Caudoviricetes sp.]